MTAATGTLQTRGLKRTLGGDVPVEILHGIDLSIAAGEFVALTGHSGSGKSTLLYLLGALDRPTAGEVWIAGRDASALDEDARGKLRNEQLGFVFQFHFLLPEFSAVENVMIPLRRRGVPEADARARAAGTLRALGLHELTDRRPGQLSGGQQQRVSIARAVANAPAIVLADEPTGNLDSQSAELVIELLSRLNRERGMTVVMVTHDEEFAERASRRVVLKDGRVVSDARAP